jgi:hypothetical protein
MGSHCRAWPNRAHLVAVERAVGLVPHCSSVCSVPYTAGGEARARNFGADADLVGVAIGIDRRHVRLPRQARQIDTVASARFQVAWRTVREFTRLPIPFDTFAVDVVVRIATPALGRSLWGVAPLVGRASRVGAAAAPALAQARGARVGTEARVHQTRLLYVREVALVFVLHGAERSEVLARAARGRELRLVRSDAELAPGRAARGPRGGAQLVQRRRAPASPPQPPL